MVIHSKLADFFFEIVEISNVPWSVVDDVATSAMTIYFLNIMFG